MGKKQILSGIGEDSDKSKIFIKNNVTLEIIRTTNFIRFWRRSGLTEVYCISTAEKVSPVCIKEKNMPDPVTAPTPSLCTQQRYHGKNLPLTCPENEWCHTISVRFVISGFGDLRPGAAVPNFSWVAVHLATLFQCSTPKLMTEAQIIATSSLEKSYAIGSAIGWQWHADWEAQP